MFCIASIDRLGKKEYLVGLTGNRMTWDSMIDAQNQVARFNSTAAWGITRQPINFRWVVEPV